MTGLPWAESPESVGLASSRLQRITSAFQAEVEQGLLPGAVLTIARAGRVAYSEVFGFRDREAGAPMAGCSAPPAST